METMDRRPDGQPFESMRQWLWHKVAAVPLVLAAWQVVVWSGWKPDYVLPGPGPVFRRLAEDLGSANFDLGIAGTLRRALVGYGIAVGIGTVAGILIARIAVRRRAIGSAILRLQSMPAVGWVPLPAPPLGRQQTAV